MSFRGRTALITGGSSGIGFAIARLLAVQGAHVWLVARDRNKLELAQARIELASTAADAKCGIVTADVADAEQAAAAVEYVTENCCQPDLVINSAGVTYPGYFQDIDLTTFHQLMDINYFGTVHITKAVVPGMMARGSGSLVNISSLAGVIGTFGYTAYGATKFAVRGFSDALRAEMKPYGVQVSIVYPPDTDTPQLAYENEFKPFETHELAGSAQVLPPETVARAVLHGVERGQYVIIPGAEGKLFYWLSGMVGSGLYPIMDLLVDRARRKKEAKR